jgi:hypothetical protein
VLRNYAAGTTVKVTTVLLALVVYLIVSGVDFPLCPVVVCQPFVFRN